MSICINRCNFKFYFGLKFKYNWYNNRNYYPSKILFYRKQTEFVLPRFIKGFETELEKAI